VVGFIGVLLIVYPNATGHEGHARSLLGVGVGVMAAFTGACAQIAVRALRHDPATTTVFYVNFLLVAALLSLPFGWHWPRSLVDWGLLSIIGFVGALSPACRFARVTAWPTPRPSRPSIICSFSGPW